MAIRPPVTRSAKETMATPGRIAGPPVEGRTPAAKTPPPPDEGSAAAEALAEAEALASPPEEELAAAEALALEIPAEVIASSPEAAGSSYTSSAEVCPCADATQLRLINSAKHAEMVAKTMRLRLLLVKTASLTRSLLLPRDQSCADLTRLFAISKR